MAELWVQRSATRLYPVGDESIAVLEKLPFDKPLLAELRQPRNLQMHRLFFALVHRVAEATGQTPENVLDLIKIATGHCETIDSEKYGTLRLPRSIAFHKMDQTLFGEFFERAVQAIYNEFKIDPAFVADLLLPSETAG